MTVNKYNLYILLMLVSATALARGAYQSSEDFIHQAFDGEPPAPKVMWLTGDAKGEITNILGHAPNSLRVRFWARQGRSAWIFEEIGKAEPITVGVIIKQCNIELIKVLVFRESRGDEVRFPFFTNQFAGAALKDDYQLDRSIDGISGATLSVRALTKIARLALYLHRQSGSE
jgi:hypothetical protein